MPLYASGAAATTALLASANSWSAQNTFADGTITDSAPTTFTQTWNDGSEAFTGIKLDVTDTSSAAASLLLDLQVGSSSKFKVNKSGSAQWSGGGSAADPLFRYSPANTNGIYFPGDGSIGFVLTSSERTRFIAGSGIRTTEQLGFTSAIGSGSDVILIRDAAAVLAQRNSTNAQTFRVYETYTDASNYERATLSCSSDAARLTAETAGTGVDNMDVVLTPAGTGSVYAGSAKLGRESIVVAVGDETTAITTGNAKTTFRMPYAFTLTEVRASLTTASSSGTPTVDINEAGSTILSTKITIDANEKTSTTAATAPVISDTALADDAEITIDIDVAGTSAAGLKVYLIGYRV
jgi:hypothetical protein